MTRINLYGRLARLEDLGKIDAFEEELEDRFGNLPAPLTNLIEQAHLLHLAKAADVRQARAGPKGVSLTMPEAIIPSAKTRLAKWADQVSQRENKIIVGVATHTDPERRDLLQALLSALV